MSIFGGSYLQKYISVHSQNGKGRMCEQGGRYHEIYLELGIVNNAGGRGAEVKTYGI